MPRSRANRARRPGRRPRPSSPPRCLGDGVYFFADDDGDVCLGAGAPGCDVRLEPATVDALLRALAATFGRERVLAAFEVSP